MSIGQSGRAADVEPYIECSAYGAMTCTRLVRASRPIDLSYIDSGLRRKSLLSFIQPFGLKSPGGGARILRALLSTPHPPVLSINTGIAPAPQTADSEIHLPLRRSFGRVEHTRFSRYFHQLDLVYSAGFRNRLANVMREFKVGAAHLIAHGYGFVPAAELVLQMELPLFLSIHDDYRCTMFGHPGLPQMERAVEDAWNRAEQVFVIGPELGDEYAQRFGKRDCEIVTDGLVRTVETPREPVVNSLRIYFMGLFHYSYRENFRAVLDALKLVRSAHPEWHISVTCRCGAVPVQIAADDVPVTVLPFASETEIENDMLSADLLYQPLPFESASANFARFSLSTKMITYLGSGLPILYHGPDYAAACRILEQYGAALTCTSLRPDQIAKELIQGVSRRQEIAANALFLARSRFMLADQQQRFWAPIRRSLEPSALPA